MIAVHTYKVRTCYNDYTPTSTGLIPGIYIYMIQNINDIQEKHIPACICDNIL